MVHEITLDEISFGLKPQTDKGSGHPGYHNYLVAYEKYTSRIRYSTKIILELGTAQGGSMDLWTSYFPDAKIYAIELLQDNIDCCMSHVDKTRVKIFKGDYTDNTFLDQVTTDISNEIDIIIDDCDHNTQNQINAFMVLGKRLKPTGFYFLEDVYVTAVAEVVSVIARSDLELMEDYTDPSRDNGHWHMLIMRRKA
jgi:cephalosporin hydroxylase